MDENSILAVTDPVLLLVCGITFCIFGGICAVWFRNTNDFGKSMKAYLPLAAILGGLAYVFLSIDLLLIIGLYICGFVCMAFVSNYFFNH